MTGVLTLPPTIQAAIADLEQHYVLVRADDRGANGYVVFGQNTLTHQPVAIKFYFGEPGARRHDEPRMLALIRAANVLPIFDARTVSDEWAYFVTPMCSGGDLDDFISQRPAAHAAIDVTLGVCNGVSAIHAAGMLHRDIKPANIVMEQGVPLIADFGSVRLLPAGQAGVAGSRHSVLYRPPEAFDGGLYTRAGDLYQVGIVAYQLLGGALSYNAEAHLGSTELTEYAQLDNDFDRSRLVDEGVRRKAVNGTLLDLSSLPPWIGRPCVAAIRQLTSPDPLARGRVSDFAASLTRIRGRTGNWSATNDGATLHQSRGVIELIRRADGKVEAWNVRPTGNRRVQRTTPGTLRQVVAQLSS